METLKVIKIGGNVIDNKEALAAFLDRFARIDGKKILVHGGGKIASQEATNRGVEVKMVNGRRITDAIMLEIVLEVYGRLNMDIANVLEESGQPATGMEHDNNPIKAHKRPVNEIDFGFVGDVDGVDTEMLTALLDDGICPVCPPLSKDTNGQMLNTNADTIASTVSTAMALFYEVELIYCFEKNGVLKDVNDGDSVISIITQDNFVLLKESGAIANGMIPKLDNSFDALNEGVSMVRICHADNLLENSGTKLTLV